MNNIKSNSDSSLFAPESKNDKDKLPIELSARKNIVELKTILDDPPGTEYTFKYGDYIPHAEQFNTYLEANVTPGKTLKIKQDELISLIKTLTLSMRAGSLSALPMPCMGVSECLMGRSCAIHLSGIHPPVGSPCPLEKSEGLGLARKLAQDVGDDRSYTDDMMIQGIVALQMLKRRVYADMANRPTPTVEVMKGMDPRGNLIMEQVENPSFGVLNTILKNEQTLLKALMLTYEQRQKKRKKTDDSAESTLAALQKRLAEVRRDKKSAIIDIDPLGKSDKKNGKNDKASGRTSGRSMGEDAGSEGDSVSSFDSLPSTGDIAQSDVYVGREDETPERNGNEGGEGDIRKQYIGKSPFS